MVFKLEGVPFPMYGHESATAISNEQIQNEPRISLFLKQRESKIPAENENDRRQKPPINPKSPIDHPIPR